MLRRPSTKSERGGGTPSWKSGVIIEAELALPARPQPTTRARLGEKGGDVGQEMR